MKFTKNKLKRKLYRSITCTLLGTFNTQSPLYYLYHPNPKSKAEIPIKDLYQLDEDLTQFFKHLKNIKNIDEKSITTTIQHDQDPNQFHIVITTPETITEWKSRLTQLLKLYQDNKKITKFIKEYKENLYNKKFIKKYMDKINFQNITLK